MSDQNHRKETINVSSLELGMFVAELDRPWLESPFMLQGFLLVNDKQIKQIQTLCKTVVIDRSLSTGKHHIEAAASNPKTTYSNSSLSVQQANKQKTEQAKPEKVSFFDILRDLNSQKISQTPSPSNRSKKINQSLKQDRASSLKSHAGNSISGQEKSSDVPQSELSISDHLKKDVSHALGKVKNWIPGIRRIKLFGASARTEAETADEPASDQEQSSSRYENIVPVEEEIAVIYPVFEQTQVATREIFEAIANENKIDLMQVNQSLDSMVESIERNPDALMWLAKLKQRDDYAYNHALNVSINLMALAHFMALPRTQIKDLGLAGLLQDIGKVKIPKALLHKHDQLTSDELELMRSHIKLGLDILNNTENISPNVLNIIANHHERIDGSGYPLKLKKNQISLTAQMAGIMDTYCALITNKSYAKGIFNQQALEQIYEARDKEFSGTLVNQLIQFIGIYPVSSLVELNSGEVAVVIQQNHVRRLQPRVMILMAADKTKYEYPSTLDLLHMPPSPNGEPYKIIRGLPPDSYGLNPADFYL